MSSGVDNALLSLSKISSEDLGTSESELALEAESPWSDASNPLLSGVSHELASSGTLSESLDDGGLVVPADSLACLTLSVERA